MRKGTILVIDDEKDLVELVRYNLEKDGFEVVGALDGASGLDVVETRHPDLILLDVMMPGMDGLEVCRRLRTGQRATRIPVIMLTARASEADRVVGLEMGADDYVTKPFSPRELVARVKAVLRRTMGIEQPPDVFRIGSLTIDIGRHEIRVDGNPIQLTATEFRILQFLAGRRGQLCSRDEIIDAALGSDASVYDRTIDVHMTGIRRKLGKGGSLVETVRGFGYKLRESNNDEAAAANG